MNNPIRLEKLRGDLKVFSSDTSMLIRDYYGRTELKTGLIFPMIQDRLEYRPEAKPIRNAYLLHVEERINNPGDPEHNHVKDVLFAIRTVRENRYEHGVPSTIEDIDKLLEALPNYQLERKEELERSLNEAKETLKSMTSK